MDESKQPARSPTLQIVDKRATQPRLLPRLRHLLCHNTSRPWNEKASPSTPITIQNEPPEQGQLRLPVHDLARTTRLYQNRPRAPQFKKAGSQHPDHRLRTTTTTTMHTSPSGKRPDRLSGPPVYRCRTPPDTLPEPPITPTAATREEMMRLHQAYPEKGLYFTEISIGLWGNGYTFADDLMWNMREVCISVPSTASAKPSSCGTSCSTKSTVPTGPEAVISAWEPSTYRAATTTHHDPETATITPWAISPRSSNREPPRIGVTDIGIPRR